MLDWRPTGSRGAKLPAIDWDCHEANRFAALLMRADSFAAFRLAGAPLLALGVSALAVALGAGVALGGLIAVGILAVVAILVVAVTRPEWAIYLIMVQVFFIDRWLTLGYVPHAARWLPDVVVLGFAFRYLVEAAGGRNPLVRVPRSLLVVLAVLVAAGTLSAVANGMNVVELAVGLRTYLRYPLLAILAVAVIPKSQVWKRYVLFLIVIAAVQVPVAAYQWVRTGIVSDFNSGTFELAGGQDLLFVCLSCAMLLVCLAMGGTRYTWLVALALGLCLAPLFAGVRAVILLAPAFLALALLAGLASAGSDRIKVASRVAVPAVALILMLASFSQLDLVLQQNLGSLAAQGGLLRYETRTRSNQTGRLTSVESAYESVSESATRTALGFGPGATAISRFAYGDLNDDLGFVIRRTQVSASLLELGVVGSASVLGVLLVLWLRIPRIPGDPDRLWRALGTCGSLVVVLYAAMLLYFAAWTAASAAPLAFWLLVGALWVRKLEQP